MTPRHRLRLARLIVEDSWPISRAVAAFRYRGRVEGRRNRAATPGKPRNRHHNPILGTAFVHTVLDDHSRVAYAEVHDDETAATAIGELRRAVSWFAARGVAVERVLSDNGPAYRSRAWRTAARRCASNPAGPGPTDHGPTGCTIQPSPAPHRDRTPPANQPLDQSVRSVQLAPSRDLRGLTPVQLQILGLLADDWTTTRIAATLGVTPRAVASQLRRGWAQLGAPARDVATLQALHEGMYVPASFLSAQD